MFGKKSPGKSVTEARLVEAAAQLFARNGYKATSTREIAQLAALNEATLFRYFPRKPDLFMAALESHLSRIKISRDVQISLAADDHPELVVPKVVVCILNILNAQPELQHLVHVAGFELPESASLIRDHLDPIFDLLSAYVKRGVDRGAIRDVEPALATLGLLGVVAAHRQFCELFTGAQSAHSDAEQAVAAYSTMCLHGICPDGETARFTDGPPEAP
jgi:AcrR family transcriptional regulator